MANRVDGADVKEIIDTELGATEVEPFITSAHAMIENRIAADINDTDLLKEIERWTSAHLVAVRDPRASKEEIGDANATYEGRSGGGTGLNATQYGQTAAQLDWTGKLASSGLRGTRIQALP